MWARLDRAAPTDIASNRERITGAIMSFYYKILYQLGITPWEEDPTQGPAAEQISTLFDREESRRSPP